MLTVVLLMLSSAHSASPEDLALVAAALRAEGGDDTAYPALADGLLAARAGDIGQQAAAIADTRQVLASIVIFEVEGALENPIMLQPLMAAEPPEWEALDGWSVQWLEARGHTEASAAWGRLTAAARDGMRLDAEADRCRCLGVAERGVPIVSVGSPTEQLSALWMMEVIQIGSDAVVGPQLNCRRGCVPSMPRAGDEVARFQMKTLSSDGIALYIVAPQDVSTTPEVPLAALASCQDANPERPWVVLRVEEGGWALVGASPQPDSALCVEQWVQEHVPAFPDGRAALRQGR